MGRFDGRVALITGAAGGIGRAIALALAKEGADIGVVDLAGTPIDDTVEEVRRLGRKASAEPGDVRDAASILNAATVVKSALGPVDILINNAGIARIGPLLEIPAQDWHETFAVNVDGVFNTTRAVVPSMDARRRGCVVNLASWLGRRGMASYGAYAASKFAVVGFTQTLALELAPVGIRVNAVAPGLIVDTQMRRDIDAESGRRGLPQSKDRAAQIPMGRGGTPEEVAKIVAFLASDDAAYVTGACYDVSGGSWMT
jgi:NAD(P)-dependent dehydrogenase (short-subunit alcohol dehydrogenase family)